MAVSETQTSTKAFNAVQRDGADKIALPVKDIIDALPILNINSDAGLKSLNQQVAMDFLCKFIDIKYDHALNVDLSEEDQNKALQFLRDYSLVMGKFAHGGNANDEIILKAREAHSRFHSIKFYTGSNTSISSYKGKEKAKRPVNLIIDILDKIDTIKNGDEIDTKTIKEIFDKANLISGEDCNNHSKFEQIKIAPSLSEKINIFCAAICQILSSPQDNLLNSQDLTKESFNHFNFIISSYILEDSLKDDLNHHQGSNRNIEGRPKSNHWAQNTERVISYLLSPKA